MSAEPRTNQWGGYCPKDYQFSHNTLKRGDCLEWQTHLYQTWYDHGKWILGGKNKNYRGKYFEPYLKDFSHFYNYMISNSQKVGLSNQFKSNPDMFDLQIDYPIPGRFERGNITLVLRKDNYREMNKRNNIKGCASIKGVKVDGKLYGSVHEASEYLGINAGTISRYSRGYKGKHIWVDKNGTQHFAEYIL